MPGQNTIRALKRAVVRQVDTERESLKALALKIHANPEPGYHETKASAWLTDYLKNQGFTTEPGFCGFPTAFRASYGRSTPQIAILAEYDALPDIGHACGHNLICTIALGAAVASRVTSDRCGGTVTVIGTPAEEYYGGKIAMAQKGAFRALDTALIVHPDSIDLATSNALACQNLTVEFFGRSAHASSRPEQGINALEAMVQSFNAINSLRQHIRSTARVHGIITDGGKAPNVVPDHSAGVFIVRAATDDYLDELEQKVLDCFRGAARATGARLEHKWDELRYAAMKNNLTLARLYAANMERLGRTVRFPAAGASAGSTDMGNVSQLVPAIHPLVAIAPRDVSLHSREFARATASETGIRGMTDAAKAVAMMIVDLLARPDILAEVKDEFRQN